MIYIIWNIWFFCSIYNIYSLGIIYFFYFFRKYFSNLICYFASFITAFFTRKILLDHLGTEFIGFTGTVGSLLSFLNLAELGIGTAIGYVLYKPIADGDKFKINEVISVLGYLYRIIGLAILSLGIIGSLFLPLIFPNTDIPLGVIYFGFYAYLAASMIGYFVNYRAALLSADQRNYIVTGYFQITTTSKVIIQMILALYYGSFYIYFAIELLGGIINSIILNWKINQTYPWLKTEVKQGKLMLKKYPEIIKYTKQLFAHKVGTLVQGQLTPFLIYSFVSLPMVALYTNYTILTQKLEGLISGVINSTNAAIGNLIAEGDKEKIFKVVYHAKRVYENINTITNHLQNSGIILTVDEYEDLYIASLFHDVGKLYKDSKRHPEFSAIIFDNISDLIFRDLSISRKSRITQMIYNHGNKLDKDPSLLYTTKILRDADLFDEKCGDSLLALALNNVVSDREIDKIKNKDIHELSGVLTKNLNKKFTKK